MNTTTCPEKNRLRDYLHGRLDEVDSDEVEEHLASCDQCEAISSRLDQDGDWLTHYLRASADEQLARESVPGWVPEVRRSMFEGPVENANHEDRFPIAAADGLVLGAYEIQEVIGRGGMGVVCRAVHRRLGRTVAVKVISTSTAPDAAGRFEREMRAVGGLHHPAIVQATDAGTADGRAYLAMELIDGVDLRRLLELAAPLSVADACEIVREAAVGLSVAHEAGIVHRDIKPSNVMLSREGQVKLLDFGLALSEEAIEATCQTSVGRLLGTLDYLAPEQTDGSAVDARADIYALGATLFTLLAGRPPMGRSTEVPILQHLRRLALQDAPPISDFRKDVPPALVQMVARMLSRDVHVRPQSAAEVAEALQGYAAGSDLPALARRACEKRDAQPPHRRGPRNLLTTPAAAWLDRRDGDVSRSVPALKSATGFRRIGRGLAMAALALALLAGGGWLGVTFLLNTGEGQLRIESQAADVRVRLLREGEHVETLEVEQGSQAVTLRAGRYEIEIDGAADEVVLSEDSVRIIRNEETVVTVMREPRHPLVGHEDGIFEAPRDPAPPLPTDLSADAVERRLAAIPDPPVYNGKGAHEWLHVLKTDLQRERQEEALRALMAIAGKLPADNRAELLLMIGQDMFASFVQDDPSRVSLVVASESRLWIDGTPTSKLLARTRGNRIVWEWKVLGGLADVPHDSLLRLTRPVLADGDLAIQAVLLRTWLWRGLSGKVTPQQATTVEEEFRLALQPDGPITQIAGLVLLSLRSDPAPAGKSFILEILANEPARHPLHVAIALRMAMHLSLDIPNETWLSALARAIAHDEIGWGRPVYLPSLHPPGVSMADPVWGNTFVRKLVPFVDEQMESPDFEARLLRPDSGLHGAASVLVGVCDHLATSPNERERAVSLLKRLVDRLGDWRDNASPSDLDDDMHFGGTLFPELCAVLTRVEGTLPDVLTRPVKGHGTLPTWFAQWREAIAEGTSPESDIVAPVAYWYPYHAMRSALSLTDETAHLEPRDPFDMGLGSPPVIFLGIAAASAGELNAADAVVADRLLAPARGARRRGRDTGPFQETFREDFHPAEGQMIQQLASDLKRHRSVADLILGLARKTQVDRLKAAAVAILLHDRELAEAYLPQLAGTDAEEGPSIFESLIASEDLPVALTAILRAGEWGLFENASIRKLAEERLVQAGFSEDRTRGFGGRRRGEEYLLQRLVLLSKFPDDQIEPILERIVESLPPAGTFDFGYEYAVIYPGDQIVKGVPLVHTLRLIGRFPEIARKHIERLQEAREAPAKLVARTDVRLSNAQREAVAEILAAFDEVLEIARSAE